MSCPIAEAIRDPLAHYKKMPRYTGPPLEEILSKKLPEGKLLCNEAGSTVDWHRHVKEHGPGPEAYAAYNIVMSGSGDVINV